MSGDSPEPPAPDDQETARRLAKEALGRFRSGQVRSRPRPATGRQRTDRPSGAGSYSGPGPDDRDPQRLGRAVGDLTTAKGWSAGLAGGEIFGRWAELVGPDIADHAVPEAFAEGTLTVVAVSTAWATQLRLLAGQLRDTLNTGLGVRLVERVTVRGPTAPSWRRGPRRVPGQGPRDTYG